MITLNFNLKDFEHYALQADQALDQVPFALAGAINDALKGARQVLVEHTWPTHVKVRNGRFIGAALHMDFANKHALRVAITDAGAPGRAHLALHNTGGTKQSKGMLAIPTAAVRLGSSGVPQGQRPRNNTKLIRKGDGLYAPVGRGKNRKLQLMYRLRRTAQQPADVPFEQDFVTAMMNGVRTSFPAAMAKAMRTRRR